MKTWTKIAIGVGAFGALTAATLYWRKRKSTTEETIEELKVEDTPLPYTVPTATVNDLGLVIRDRSKAVKGITAAQGTEEADRQERDYERQQYGY